MNRLERAFLNTVSREALFPEGTSVCAAVSGGADSVAMVHLLSRYSRSRGWSVRVLHINHRLRPDAGADLRFVRELADSLSLPFTAVTLDPGTAGSVESRWSKARQKVYASQPETVAVAHNAGDRAETLLLRLVEGAGLRGLGGMDYRGIGPVRRPMLDLEREEIRSWLSAQGIPWAEDTTNTDTSIARNRMRLNVLPALVNNFPEAVQGICRSGAVLSNWRDLQDQITGMFAPDGIERKAFNSLPEVLGSLALWSMSGRPRKGFEEFVKVTGWINRGGTGEHILPGGKRLIAEADWITVEDRGPGRF